MPRGRSPTRGRTRSPSSSRSASPSEIVDRLNAVNRGWREQKRKQATVWIKGNRTFYTVTDAMEHNRALFAKNNKKSLLSLLSLKKRRSPARRSGRRVRK